MEHQIGKFTYTVNENPMRFIASSTVLAKQIKEILEFDIEEYSPVIIKDEQITFTGVSDKYIIIHQNIKTDFELPFFPDRWRSLLRIMAAAPEQPVSITINQHGWFSINLQA